MNKVEMLYNLPMDQRFSVFVFVVVGLIFIYASGGWKK